MKDNAGNNAKRVAATLMLALIADVGIVPVEVAADLESDPATAAESIHPPRPEGLEPPPHAHQESSGFVGLNLPRAEMLVTTTVSVYRTSFILPL